jgi:hypothetical protein
MSNAQRIAIMTAIIAALGTVVVSAEPYTFSGYVTYTPFGNPIPDEVVAIRYVYTFEGVAPHEGRATLATNQNGYFELNTDITNIWGGGPIISVVAWGTVRLDEHYMENAQPNTNNQFTTWAFHPGKPDPGGDPESGSIAVDEENQSDEPMSWGRIKAIFR